ncbi:MAG: type II secretion system protein GspK, partial [Candidatus Omnitrophota bacterium]|nr:type II secretion system protein GspK [Candidatus Omnitrophota bacterium]
MNLKRKKGAILIITLWILAILTILSVGIAGRMGLELKLAGYYRDNMKALYLAKAGIERAVAEKEINDTVSDADTLNETWANSPGLFDKKNPFGEGTETGNSYYTVKYTYKESKEAEGVDLYGMEDEASKININKIVSGDTVDTVRKEQLITLLELICGPDVDATAKVDALIDWIDTGSTAQGTSEDENSKYYPDMGSGYCKNGPLDSIEELFLVKGFEDPAILYGDKNQGKIGIIDYITIHPDDGKVNVNTAPREVLQALGFKDDFETIADKIIVYRNDLGNSPITNPTIADPNGLKTILSLSPEESDKVDSVKLYLTATSTVFRINA